MPKHKDFEERLGPWIPWIFLSRVAFQPPLKPPHHVKVNISQGGSYQEILRGSKCKRVLFVQHLTKWWGLKMVFTWIYMVLRVSRLIFLFTFPIFLCQNSATRLKNEFTKIKSKSNFYSFSSLFFLLSRQAENPCLTLACPVQRANPAVSMVVSHVIKMLSWEGRRL